MKKLILLILAVAAISLIGASVVFAQDGTQTTPGTTDTSTICPNGGNGTGGNGNGGNVNLEQMAQRHEAMGANVPADMQERHAAMGAAIQSGDVAKIQELRNEMRGSGTCQNRGNGGNAQQ